MEKERYNYFISYVYTIDSFSFADIFCSSKQNYFGNVFVNYDTKLEDFLIENYNEVKRMIAKSVCEQYNEMKKKAHEQFNKENEYKYDENLVTENNITIINIVPKKYEVFKNVEEREN